MLTLSMGFNLSPSCPKAGSWKSGGRKLHIMSLNSSSLGSNEVQALRIWAEPFNAVKLLKALGIKISIKIGYYSEANITYPSICFGKGWGNHY